MPKQEVEGFRDLMNRKAEMQGKYQETNLRLKALENIAHLGLEGSEQQVKTAAEEFSELTALKKIFDTACYKEVAGQVAI